MHKNKAKLIAMKLTEWLDGKNIPVEDILKALKEGKSEAKKPEVSEDRIKDAVKTAEKILRTNRPSVLLAASEDEDGNMDVSMVSAKGTQCEITCLACCLIKALLKQIKVDYKMFNEGVEQICKKDA